MAESFSVNGVKALPAVPLLTFGSIAAEVPNALVVAVVAVPPKGDEVVFPVPKPPNVDVVAGLLPKSPPPDDVPNADVPAVELAFPNTEEGWVSCCGCCCCWPKGDKAVFVCVPKSPPLLPTPPMPPVLLPNAPPDPNVDGCCCCCCCCCCCAVVVLLLFPNKPPPPVVLLPNGEAPA